MRFQECVEYVAFNADGAAEAVDEIKSFVIKTCEDQEVFFWIDEIIQETIEMKPESKMNLFDRLAPCFLDLLSCEQLTIERKGQICKTTSSLAKGMSKAIRAKFFTKNLDKIVKTGKLLLTVGDFEIQILIVELLVRLSHVGLTRDLCLELFNWRPELSQIFFSITKEDFEPDARNFINRVNFICGENARVLTYPCHKVEVGNIQVYKPSEAKYEHFWVDFNMGSNSILIFCQRDDGTEGNWNGITISAPDIVRMVIISDHMILHLEVILTREAHLLFDSATLEDFPGKSVKIAFNSTLPIPKCISKVFPGLPVEMIEQEKVRFSRPIRRLQMSGFDEFSASSPEPSDIIVPTPSDILTSSESESPAAQNILSDDDKAATSKPQVATNPIEPAKKISEVDEIAQSMLEFAKESLQVTNNTKDVTQNVAEPTKKQTARAKKAIEVSKTNEPEERRLQIDKVLKKVQEPANDEPKINLKPTSGPSKEPKITTGTAGNGEISTVMTGNNAGAAPEEEGHEEPPQELKSTDKLPTQIEKTSRNVKKTVVALKKKEPDQVAAPKRQTRSRSGVQSQTKPNQAIHNSPIQSEGCELHDKGVMSKVEEGSVTLPKACNEKVTSLSESDNDWVEDLEKKKQERAQCHLSEMNDNTEVPVSENLGEIVPFGNHSSKDKNLNKKNVSSAKEAGLPIVKLTKIDSKAGSIQKPLLKGYAFKKKAKSVETTEQTVSNDKDVGNNDVISDSEDLSQPEPSQTQSKLTGQAPVIELKKLEQAQKSVSVPSKVTKPTKKSNFVVNSSDSEEDIPLAWTKRTAANKLSKNVKTTKISEITSDKNIATVTEFDQHSLKRKEPQIALPSKIDCGIYAECEKIVDNVSESGDSVKSHIAAISSSKTTEKRISGQSKKSAKSSSKRAPNEAVAPGKERSKPMTTSVKNAAKDVAKSKTPTKISFESNFASKSVATYSKSEADPNAASKPKNADVYNTIDESTDDDLDEEWKAFKERQRQREIARKNPVIIHTGISQTSNAVSTVVATGVTSNVISSNTDVTEKTADVTSSKTNSTKKVSLKRKSAENPTENPCKESTEQSAPVKKSNVVNAKTQKSPLTKTVSAKTTSQVTPTETTKRKAAATKRASKRRSVNQTSEENEIEACNFDLFDSEPGYCVAENSAGNPGSGDFETPKTGVSKTPPLRAKVVSSDPPKRHRRNGSNIRDIAEAVDLNQSPSSKKTKLDDSFIQGLESDPEEQQTKMKTPKLVKGLPSLNSKKLSFAETATFIENTPNSVNEESATDEEFVNQNEISQNDQIVVGASQIEIESEVTNMEDFTRNSSLFRSKSELVKNPAGVEDRAEHLAEAIKNVEDYKLAVKVCESIRCVIQSEVDSFRSSIRHDFSQLMIKQESLILDHIAQMETKRRQLQNRAHLEFLSFESLLQDQASTLMRNLDAKAIQKIRRNN